jgi:hypothetical protein
MSHTTQWVYVPPGASGSSTISATVAVPEGRPDQASGGEVPSPLQVYRAGIFVPAPNAVLVTGIEPAAVAGGGWGFFGGWEEEQAATAASRRSTAGPRVLSI